MSAPTHQYPAPLAIIGCALYYPREYSGNLELVPVTDLEGISPKTGARDTLRNILGVLYGDIAQLATAQSLLIDENRTLKEELTRMSAEYKTATEFLNKCESNKRLYAEFLADINKTPVQL